MQKKYFFASCIFVAIVILGCSLFWTKDTAPTSDISETVSDAEPSARPLVSSSTIGYAAEGRDIQLFTFGIGQKTILFVGGIHGGYEVNTVALAWKFIHHFAEHVPPENVRVAIIPNLNPDGVFAATGIEGIVSESDVTRERKENKPLGRFNANGVDLNRNFDCRWQATSTWQNRQVSAGSHPFSEPEAQILRDIVATISPDTVIFWHSKANAVYASECEQGVLPLTKTILDVYAAAADYTPIETFDAYPVTGDAEGWLAKIGIPAITVELASHSETDWEKNVAGVEAVLKIISNMAVSQN